MESKIPQQFKNNVIEAIKADRANYGGSNKAYSKTIDLNYGIVGDIINGKDLTGKISDSNYIRIGRLLGVNRNQTNWKVTRTSIYNEIEDSLRFCKENSATMILVDDCGIGKTFCAKHILKSMKDAFYVDCSQCKSKNAFIKALAQTIGSGTHGKYSEILADLKYYISNVLDKPLIVLDEAGDLDAPAFLEIKAIYNATVDACGWYMMGANGLRKKIEKGVNNDKLGYEEILSRFSDEIVKLVPTGKENRDAFYMDLIRTVVSAQIDDVEKVNKIVRQCLNKKATLRNLKNKIELVR
ncbi:ATP-binding protein [Empedobacter falsenii]